MGSWSIGNDYDFIQTVDPVDFRFRDLRLSALIQDRDVGLDNPRIAICTNQTLGIKKRRVT